MGGRTRLLWRFPFGNSCRLDYYKKAKFFFPGFFRSVCPFNGDWTSSREDRVFFCRLLLWSSYSASLGSHVHTPTKSCPQRNSSSSNSTLFFFGMLYNLFHSCLFSQAYPISRTAFLPLLNSPFRVSVHYRIFSGRSPTLVLESNNFSPSAYQPFHLHNNCFFIFLL